MSPRAEIKVLVNDYGKKIQRSFSFLFQSSGDPEVPITTHCKIPYGNAIYPRWHELFPGDTVVNCDGVLLPKNVHSRLPTEEMLTENPEKYCPHPEKILKIEDIVLFPPAQPSKYRDTLKPIKESGQKTFKVKGRQSTNHF